MKAIFLVAAMIYETTATTATTAYETTCGHLKSAYQNATCCSSPEQSTATIDLPDEAGYDCTGIGAFLNNGNNEVVATNFTHTVWEVSPRAPVYVNVTLNTLQFRGKNGVITKTLPPFETFLTSVVSASTTYLHLSVQNTTATVPDGTYVFTLDPAKLPYNGPQCLWKTSIDTWLCYEGTIGSSSNSGRICPECPTPFQWQCLATKCMYSTLGATPCRYAYCCSSGDNSGCYDAKQQESL